MFPQVNASKATPSPVRRCYRKLLPGDKSPGALFLEGLVVLLTWDVLKYLYFLSSDRNCRATNVSPYPGFRKFLKVRDLVDTSGIETPIFDCFEWQNQADWETIAGPSGGNNKKIIGDPGFQGTPCESGAQGPSFFISIQEKQNAG
jgi:hypothetical protein